MTKDNDFKTFVLDQLSNMGAFETKNMFGGTALLRDGTAFAKVKHGALWLKVDDSNRSEFEAEGMPQYTYGKDGTRRLNFYQTPPHVLEDAETLKAWAEKACIAAANSK